MESVHVNRRPPREDEEWLRENKRASSSLPFHDHPSTTSTTLYISLSCPVGTLYIDG
jgi:hypothetical protein